MQVISIIYADVIFPRKTLDMLNTDLLLMLLFSEEENEEFEDMLNSMRDVLVSTGKPYLQYRPRKKQTTNNNTTTTKKKNITEYTSPYRFNL